MLFLIYMTLKNISPLLSVGSATTLICLLDPETVSGEFYANCNIKRNELHPKMNDEELARKLWEVSESLVKLDVL